jgi:hypothetical protein
MTMSNRTHLMSLATFTALCVLPGVSTAGEGSDYLLSASYVSDEARSEERASEPVTCKDANQTAWFLHQMELTDGEVSPNVAAPIDCQRAVIASATEQAE